MELIFSAFKKFQIMGKSLRTKLIKKENKKKIFILKIRMDTDLEYSL